MDARQGGGDRQGPLWTCGQEIETNPRETKIMRRFSYFVIINNEQLNRLKELVRQRYRFYGRILIHRIETNAVIKAESLSVQILDGDSIGAEICERISELIHGFIVGADLKNSTDNLCLSHQEDKGQ